MFVSLVLVISLWKTGESMGIQPVDPVIIGGKTISVEEAPFIALYISIIRGNSKGDQMLSCGANIITERFLVSAAHCYVERNIDQYIVTGTDIGYLDQSNVNGKVNIEKAIKHPKYNDRTISHDLLVIKLAKRLQFNSRVQPIKMESRGDDIPQNSMLQTFGYGLSEFKGSSRLRKANVPFVDRHTCRSQFVDDQVIDHKTICAGADGLGGCSMSMGGNHFSLGGLHARLLLQEDEKMHVIIIITQQWGDSGGPLVYNNRLVGITSFGSTECGMGPVVYTRVGVFRNFIEQTIQSNS